MPQTNPNLAYNRSKRRVQVEISNDEDKGQLVSKRLNAKKEKVDVGSAISSLSNELKAAREIKASHKTVSQQAVHLLKVKYSERLDLIEFIQGCTFFKDKGNAGIFLAINNAKKRDRWLEINLGVELKNTSI
jgi:hypothetical protein